MPTIIEQKRENHKMYILLKLLNEHICKLNQHTQLIGLLTQNLENSYWKWAARQLAPVSPTVVVLLVMFLSTRYSVVSLLLFLSQNQNTLSLSLHSFSGTICTVFPQHAEGCCLFGFKHSEDDWPWDVIFHYRDKKPFLSDEEGGKKSEPWIGYAPCRVLLLPRLTIRLVNI